MEDRICDLEADLRAMSRLKPVAAVNYIRKVIGYDDYLRSYAEFRRMKPEELFETADKLAESAAEFETFEAWKEHAVRYEEELKKQNLEGTREAKDRVTLSTMHSAKGLEYPVVFVVDVNEGIVPHHKAGLPADIEEERRLFYVALTEQRTGSMWRRCGSGITGRRMFRGLSGKQVCRGFREEPESLRLRPPERHHSREQFFPAVNA